MKKVHLFLLVFVLVFTAGIQFTFADSNQFKGSSSISDEKLEKNLSFRKKVGLVYDRQKVMNIMTNEGSVKGYGIVLTKEEKKMLDERFNRQNEKIPLIKQYIKNNVAESIFAGLYIDQSQGGIINIGFKSNLEEMDKVMQGIKDIYGDSHMIRFYKANYTEKELDALHSQVYEKLNYLEDQGINYIFTRTDLPDQGVEIGIENVTKQAESVIYSFLDKQMVNVVQAEVQKNDSSTTKQRPLEGGLRINSDAGKICTGAFSAQGEGLDNNLYFITAGHCGGDDWSQGGTSYSSSNKIGTITKREWNGGHVDAAAIHLDNYSDISYDLYAYDTHDLTTFTEVGNTSTEDVGDIVCISGGNSDDTSCGEILSTSWSGNFDDGYYTNLREADYSAIGGDSGGPIYEFIQGGARIHGVHKGGQGTEKYSHIIFVNDELGINPILGN